jgi:chemotaxis protein MotB
LPIHTESFPPNWELLTARASNETPKDRQRNRRVAVMILSTDVDKATVIPIAKDIKD